MFTERLATLEFESIPKLAARLGIGFNTVYGWLNYGKEPQARMVLKIAIEFKTSMAYLLGHTTSRDSVYPDGFTVEQARRLLGLRHNQSFPSVAKLERTADDKFLTIDEVILCSTQNSENC